MQDYAIIDADEIDEIDNDNADNDTVAINIELTEVATLDGEAIMRIDVGNHSGVEFKQQEQQVLAQVNGEPALKISYDKVLRILLAECRTTQGLKDGDYVCFVSTTDGSFQAYNAPDDMPLDDTTKQERYFNKITEQGVDAYCLAEWEA